MAGSEKECAVGQPTSFDHHRLKTRYDDIDYKIFKAKYLGHSMLDKRYTQSMLPWIMTEIRRSSSTTLCNEVSLWVIKSWELNKRNEIVHFVLYIIKQITVF